jgi:Methyltransferase domain
MSIKAMIPRKVRRIVKQALGMQNPARGAPEPLEVLANDAREYWSASATSADQRDMSHWLGEGRWSDAGGWRRIGDEHFELYRKLVQLSGRTSPIRTMLEWGPGGGANAIRFAEGIPEFIGVDISEPNLKECARQLEAHGHHIFQGILVDAPNPEGVLAKSDKPVDFFLSTAVFQHFPDKEYGVRVTKIAHQLLAKDGIALIQTRYDNGIELFKPKKNNYKSNVAYFTSYMIDEYWNIARDTGFRTLAVSLRPETNYAFYLLAKQGRECKVN